MILNREQVREQYARVAPFYDGLLWLYRPFGVRRRRVDVVRHLSLEPGDTVVDLGCGSGANFPILLKAVGSSGRLVGVDLSPDMLERARDRVRDQGWTNVELVEADVVQYEIPADTDAVVATFSLEMVPEYDRVIRRLATDLQPGGRLGLVGLKEPEKWPEWLIRFGIWVNRPFGVTRDYARLRPWESVMDQMRVDRYDEWLAGAGYLCVGVKR